MSAPLPGSTWVTTCIADFDRRSPSTHSAYPVAESLRDRPDSFRTFSTENLIGASRATYTHSSVRMPPSACSKTL